MIVLEAIPSLTLFCLMLAMGMGLRVADFTHVLSEPLAALLGIVGQLIVLPAVAISIALLLALPGPVAVGLLLIAACPGGTVSNAFTWLARGDMALSISLTAVSSLVAFLWVPAVLGLGLSALEVHDAAIALPFAETAQRLIVTTALPLVLGMAVLRARPHWAARVQRPLMIGSISVLMLLVLALPVQLAADDSVDLVGLFASGLVAVSLLLAIMTGSALLAARMARLERRSGVTLAIEVGIQNFNLAMVIALSILREPIYLGTGIVYLFAMIGVAQGLVWLGRRSPAPIEAHPVAS